MTMIVTNRNREAHSGRFNGTLYTFPPNEPVKIPEAAAIHLFAYGKSDADRQRVLVRNGWQRSGKPGDVYGPEAAMKRLMLFVFQVIEDPPPVPKEKKVVKVPERKPTGVRAMSSLVGENGQRATAPSPIAFPGSSTPIAPG